MSHIYLKTVTQPLRSGKQNTGLEALIGLKVNLHPKLKTESLMKDTDTIGLQQTKQI